MNAGRGIAIPAHVVVVIGVLVSSGPVHAGPPRLVSEDVSPGIRVNGVPLHIVRLTGSGVPDFARELQQTWYPAPEAGSPWANVGGWRVMSRRSGHWSEVLQVRKVSSPEEALLSRIDVEHPPTPVRRLRLELPASCRVTSTVEFAPEPQAQMQVSARCTAGPAEVRAAVQAGAEAAGWSHATQSGGSMQTLIRGPTQVTVLIGGDREHVGRNGSWLVALERSAKDAPP